MANTDSSFVSPFISPILKISWRKTSEAFLISKTLVLISSRSPKTDGFINLASSEDTTKWLLGKKNFLPAVKNKSLLARSQNLI
ncbi:hypothetical protein CCAL_1064 [Campylobacter californiensis]|nr:hypothetical protein CCAL_1064 [Campylobacter sp. RM6914]